MPKETPTELIIQNDLEAKTIVSKKEALSTPMTVPPVSLADIYAQTVALPLYLFMIILWLMWSVMVYPLCALGAFYTLNFVHRPHDRFDGPGFYFLIILTYPYAAFLYAIAAFWWYMCMGWCLLTGLPVMLVRILIGQGGDIANNFRLLWPFMKMNKFTYIGVARCVLGQIDRQGLNEFVWGNPIEGGIGAAVSLLPIIKYFWQINPFLFTLEEMFISQWTYPLNGTGLDEKRIIHGCKKMVSRAVQNKTERKIEDESKFCANYPWGASMGAFRDVVIGLQFPNGSKTCNFTQTIHITDGSCRSSKYSYQGQPPTGKTGVYLVILNALSWHFLTGWVEVNYRHDHGLEHPMWCIIPKNSHFGVMSYGWVNNLFANFVPDVVAFEVEDYEEHEAKIAALRQKNQ